MTYLENNTKILEIRAKMIEDRNKRKEAFIPKKTQKKSGKTTQKKTITINKPHVYNDNDSNEYHNWKNGIYAKFQCTCQKCKGGKETHLTVHHIYNYFDNPNRRTDPTNGILLCQHCHELYHERYGGRYNNRQQLTEFLSKR